MNNAAIKKLCVLGIVLGFAAYAPRHAAAACALGEDRFAELKAVQENFNVDYLEKARSELTIRKQLLHATIDCAAEEANIVKAGLERFSDEDPALQTLRTQILGQLENSISYYRAEEIKIDDLGLQGSRSFAQSLKDWREGNYKPAVKNAANLLLWANSQDLIEKARARMESIKPTIGLAKIVDNQEIQNLWKDAQARFEEATSRSQQAALSLRERDDSDTVLDIIKSSLEALSATYQKLLDISAAFSAIP
jgi:hypothetical protein